MFELKLPGAGEGAREEPRGAKVEFDIFRGALSGAKPSRSKLVLEVVVL